MLTRSSQRISNPMHYTGILILQFNLCIITMCSITINVFVSSLRRYNVGLGLATAYLMCVIPSAILRFLSWLVQWGLCGVKVAFARKFGSPLVKSAVP